MGSGSSFARHDSFMELAISILGMNVLTSAQACARCNASTMLSRIWTTHFMISLISEEREGGFAVEALLTKGSKSMNFALSP